MKNWTMKPRSGNVTASSMVRESAGGLYPGKNSKIFQGQKRGLGGGVRKGNFFSLIYIRFTIETFPLKKIGPPCLFSLERHDQKWFALGNQRCESTPRWARQGVGACKKIWGDSVYSILGKNSTGSMIV